MPKVFIEFLNKNYSLLHEEELENAPVPRVGEVIHYEEHVDRGMAWYLVRDVRYTLKDKEMTAFVTAHAVSSDPYKGIDDARTTLMNTDGWVSTELADDPELID